MVIMTTIVDWFPHGQSRNHNLQEKIMIAFYDHWRMTYARKSLVLAHLSTVLGRTAVQTHLGQMHEHLKRTCKDLSSIWTTQEEIDRLLTATDEVIVEGSEAYHVACIKRCILARLQIMTEYADFLAGRSGLEARKAQEVRDRLAELSGREIEIHRRTLGRGWEKIVGIQEMELRAFEKWTLDDRREEKVQDYFLTYEIPRVLADLMRSEAMQSFYSSEEATQLLRDGLEAADLQVTTFPGCEGKWVMTFRREGQFYIACGDCWACPSCEVNMPDPKTALENWLRDAWITNEYANLGAMVKEARWGTLPVELQRLTSDEESLRQLGYSPSA
ncbi:MAG: hypothetical protein NUV84_01575 [Candidatus Uhrbacteria bacterium]|nr:hypothetical protein [Candidatus Uhrbacteria bacterium]